MKRHNSIATSILMTTASILMTASALAANGPVLHPNAQRYHVRSPSTATGRSGSASLSARALLGKNGTTSVDITTGDLESQAPAPGNIGKVQLKTFSDDGDLIWTQNHSGLTSGGTLHYEFKDLRRGQSVQTQANITGIDGQRTDVVTVIGDVKRRPDLVVRTVDAPEQATAGAMLNIAATIQELNGDVGATGDCVLLVDGAEVDHAAGIYVDSGSIVTCAFSHVFDEVGIHLVEVRVSGVAPSDWDTSNNAATRSIDILSGNAAFNWVAHISRSTTIQSGHDDVTLSHSEDNLEFEWNWTETTSSVATWETSAFYGWAHVALAFPLTSVTAQQTSDGVVVSSFNLENISPDWSSGDSSYGSNHLSRFDPATFSYLYIETSWTSENDGKTTARMWKYGGEVTFFSYVYGGGWISLNGATYQVSWAWNYDYEDIYGATIWPMNSTVTTNVDITDANGVELHANAVVPMVPFDEDWIQPYSCEDYVWDTGAQRVCSEYEGNTSGTSGHASGVN